MKIYCLLLLGSMITFSSCEKKAKIVYPETAKGNTVDTYSELKLPTLTAGWKMTHRQKQQPG